MTRPPATAGAASATGSTSASAAVIRRRLTSQPRLAIVLGSGFGSVLSRVAAAREIPYSKVPGFPSTTVAGHTGKLVLGRLGGTEVLLLSGRAHYYEGHPMVAVTFPIRVLAELGIENLLLTNAAGGIHRRLRPGDFMCLTDHINLMGANPLRGPVQPGRARFLDLTHVYDEPMGRLLQRAARQCGARIHRGVYLALSGPTYETPAEIRAFARLGADAVGMSTVPEAIVARHCGLRVAALSCITNQAAGLGPGILSHEDVLQLARQNETTTAALLENFARLHAKF